jgi:hypothetical protein
LDYKPVKIISMKKLFIVFTLIIASNYLHAQTEISAFNATGAGYSTSYLADYQCLGVNPANLGWTRNNHTMNIGFFEFTGSIYAEPLTRSQIVNDMFNSSFKLDAEGKLDAAQNFVDARVIGLGSVMGIGFSYQDEEIGGFAFSIRERFMWHSILNDNGASYLYIGYNDPYFDSLAVENGETVGYSTNSQLASIIYNGTDNHMLTYREYNFGYGRKVIKKENFTWYLGVGLKYLVGYGMTQYYQNDNGDLVGYSALSPTFGVEYDEPTPSQIDGTGYKKVGSGFGFDIGTTFEYKEKLRVSLALNDIGSIKWNGNVYMANDTRAWKIETAGLDNYNIFEQGDLIVTDNHPDDPNTWTGLEEKKFNLPMNLRGGVSYRFNEMIEAGADIYVPLGDKVPGVYEQPVFGLGCRYDPAEWVQLSIGVVSGGKFGTNVPFGVIFYPIKKETNTWEIGFSTRDMTSFFKSKNPTVSLAFGFLRFSFGAKEASTRYLEEE